ncbi:MAG TPA: pre-peptidase C-terminal domain-containing protein, partial [Turneriella sp.]|nr:pre-peptidase C-terminal domain-containing protein [Turneriella sp.]
YTRLYPIGLFANISGAGVLNPGLKRFTHQVKQTYEKFLTEKVGLTISGRMGALQLTSTLPQRNWDYDTIYVHFDDTPRILPNPPEGRWSNHVPVNPLATTCTPTVTENCSPKSNGVLTEGIGADTRTVQWDLKTYVYYHFYAAAPGSYTIETTGSTDTHITLIAQTGANLGSDDDSGSGSNARMTITLSRGWYYVKVRGKNDNVFGFFDVRVTGPVAAEINYGTMLSPTATYGTTCATNNGNMVLSWYDATSHLLYVAAPGEGGACSANGTIEKHGPVGEIVRGRFDGSLRPIAPSGANATVQSSLPFRGFFNVIRQE